MDWKLYEEAYRRGYEYAIKRIHDYFYSRDFEERINNLHLCDTCNSANCKGRLKPGSKIMIECESWSKKE